MNDLTVTEQHGMTALSSVQMAELDVQVTTAKAYPRDVAQCIKDMKSYVEALGPETAEDLFYVLPAPKGGDGIPIEGPSVRMAEICASTWGNMRLQAHIVETGERTVVAEAVCWDLEKNTAISVQKIRPIYGKYGRYNDNLIAKTALAAQSIALRDAVFRILPRPVIDALTSRAKILASQSGDVEKKRAAMFAYFKGLGIEEETILKYLECATVDEITPSQLVTMRGLVVAIKEGQTTAEEVFAPKPESTETGAEVAIKRLIQQITQEADALMLDAVMLRAAVKDKYQTELDAMTTVQLAVVLKWIRERKPDDFKDLREKNSPKPEEPAPKRGTKPAEGNLV